MLLVDSQLYSPLDRLEGYSGVNMGVVGQRKDSDLSLGVVGRGRVGGLVVRGGGLLLLGLVTAGGQQAGHRWLHRTE